MPGVARDLLAGGPLVYGVLLGAFGIGAVCAAFISGRLRAHMPNQRIVQIASLAVAIGATGAGLSTSLPLTIVALLIAGLGWVLALSTLNATVRSAEHTSELQSLMRISYAVFCLKKK